MKKALVITVTILAFITLSCKKNASQFQGQVRFVDSTGAYFPADSAIITIHKNDTAKAATLTSTADGEGIYLITDVPDGVWVVKGVLMIDSNTTYVGVTSKFESSGKDFIAAPVDMIEI
jgi:hypothetical protein